MVLLDKVNQLPQILVVMLSFIKDSINASLRRSLKLVLHFHIHTHYMKEVQGRRSMIQIKTEWHKKQQRGKKEKRQTENPNGMMLEEHRNSVSKIEKAAIPDMKRKNHNLESNMHNRCSLSAHLVTCPSLFFVRFFYSGLIRKKTKSVQERPDIRGIAEVTQSHSVN